MEVDIGKSTDESSLKRRRTDSDSTSHPLESELPESSLFVHFSRTSALQSRAQRYQWVKQVQNMAQFKHIKGALELRSGRQNIYIKCKNIDILNLLTTQGALGEILIVPRVHGKQQCINLIVFDVPLTVEMEELTQYNPSVVHARRITQRGYPTQRVNITYEGTVVPKKLKIVEGLTALRCGIFHSLTPFCTFCSKWGHSYRGCPRDVARCMYCAGHHHSTECADKIARNIVVPKKCVNCRYDHNANSPLCMFYPKDRKKKNVAPAAKHHSPTTAPAPQLADRKQFPSLPGQSASKPRCDHAPGATGVPWGEPPRMQQKVPVDDEPAIAIAPMGPIVLRSGYAPGGACAKPRRRTPSPKKPQITQNTTKVPGGDSAAPSRPETPMEDASSTTEVPGDHRLPAVSQGKTNITPEIISKSVPPGIPPNSNTVRDPIPAASSADQDTANTLKETLHTIKEMLQTLTVLVQQMIRSQQRNDPILPAGQANGANI